jgi:sirohydrochlorin ferrochelatase
MRTADECLAMAAEMDQKAERCGESPVRNSYLAMAKTWRYVAADAKRQDAHHMAAVPLEN